MTNCQNCGAPITRHTCEYCGTVFLTNQEDRAKKRRIEIDNELYIAKYGLSRDMDLINDLYATALAAMRRYADRY